MFSTRRQFLRVAMTGAATLPLAGKLVASDLLTAPTDFRPAMPLCSTTSSGRHSNISGTKLILKPGWCLTAPARMGEVTCKFSSIAATGFGLTAMCIGYEREYRSRSQIEDRVAQTLDFISRSVPTEHGFLYHFLDPETGQRVTAV